MKIVSFENKLKSGEHDQLWKGKPVKLNIQPMQKGGFVLLYTMEHEVHPFGDCGPSMKHSHSLCAVEVKFRWWHKMLFMTEESRIDFGMKRLKKRWAYMKHHTEQFDAICEKYGIDNGDT